MKSIQVNPEIIEQLAREMFNELEENAMKTGGKMTFDYIEGGVLQLRQKLGVQIMQRVIEMLGTGKIDQNKTPNSTAIKSGKTKGMRKRKSSRSSAI